MAVASLLGGPLCVPKRTCSRPCLIHAYREANADGGGKRGWMECSRVELDEERSFADATVAN